ncbi:MAG: hypothetical protein Q8Q09_01045 [Deltaproteobacteria bacterium]|nr:hypothetical protein [Deltaproteobacteria bacterium]
MNSKTTDKTTPPPAAASALDDPKLALASLQDELAAMPAERVAHYALEARFAANAVLKTLAKVEPLMAKIAELPMDTKPIERLPVFARALTEANALVQAHTPSAATTDTVLARARNLRQELLMVCDRLVFRGALKSDEIERLREGQGYRDLLNDLDALQHKLRPFVPAFVALEELDEAKDLAVKLTGALPDAKPETPALGALHTQRAKVATLLTHAYNELTAAVAFVRRAEGDSAAWVSTIRVPPGRTARTRQAGEPEPEPSELLGDTVAPEARDPKNDPFAQVD